MNVKIYYKLWVPEIFSISIMIFSIFFKFDIAQYDYKFILSNCVCFVSIIVSSLITLVSMSVMNLNNKYLKSIRQFDPDELLTYYLGSPVVSGVILAILSIVFALIIDSNLNISTSNPFMKSMISNNCIYITSFWLVLTVYFIYSSMRAAYINIEILKISYLSKMEINNELVNNIEKVCEMVSED